jgi:hypothetical protein
MQAIGMNGMEYLTTTDPLHVMTMGVMHKMAREELQKLDRDRAVMIANAVSKLFKRG